MELSLIMKQEVYQLHDLILVCFNWQLILKCRKQVENGGQREREKEGKRVNQRLSDTCLSERESDFLPKKICPTPLSPFTPSHGL